MGPWWPRADTRAHTRAVPLLWTGDLEDCGPGGCRSLIKGGLCFAASSRDRMAVLCSQLALRSASQTEPRVPRAGSLGRAVREAPANGLFPLFLLQSARTREVHQVSMCATPRYLPAPVSSVLRSSPVASPPSGPFSVTGILGGSLPPTSRPIQEFPQPASSAGLSPLRPHPGPPKPGPWE